MNMDQEIASHPKRRDPKYRAQLKRIAEEFNANGKPTVAMACDSFFPLVDGVVNVLDNYARLLYGDVNVIVLAPTVKGRVWERGYPVLGVTSLYSKRLNYQIALPAFDRFCARYLKTLRIDLIHCHSPFFLGRYMLKLHKKRGIPLLSTFHSQYKRDFERYAGARLSRLLLRFIMKVFNGSDEVWTMHEASKETLLGYGYRGAVKLIPNGTSFPPSADYERERREAREFYGADGPLFLFVGRIVEQKNVLFLADVLAELQSRGVAFRMIFAGDGPDRPQLEKRLKQSGTEGRVRMLGHVSDPETLSRLYAAADLFLFPSLYDVSSIVQIEAASRRTPAVFAEGSVTSRTVTDGVNGFLLPCDVKGFADGIERILRDGETLARVSENAYRDLYVTWEEVVAKAKQGYLELIEKTQQ